jgi:hypothetical protein
MYSLGSIPSAGNSLSGTLAAAKQSYQWGAILPNLDRKTFLDGREDFLISLAADERDAETFGTKAPSTSDTMQVRVCIGWKIIVDRKIDLLDINTTSKDISGNTDAFVKLLELLVSLNTIVSLVRGILYCKK